jgi:hypothetical protein
MNKIRTKNAEVSPINGHPACLSLGVQSKSVSERSPDNRSKKQEREINTAVPALLPWNRSQESCSCHSETEKQQEACRGMNIAVNRLCTGNGSTEAE